MCYNILHLFDYVSMDIYQIDHKEHYADIVSRLVEDHILLYPTDTLRGIGSVISTQSVKHIKDIKQRSQHKTHMSIIVPDRSWIQTYTLDADI